MNHVYVQAEPDELFFHIHEIIRLFYPGAELIRGETGRPLLRFQRCNQGQRIYFAASYQTDNHIESFQKGYHYSGENDQRRLARIFAAEILTKIRGTLPLPYGILTGIRPTKLVHRMLDNQWTREQVLNHLTADYLLSANKADLLWQISEGERPFLHPPAEARRLISVYVGIPYCPTRCHYCSFPGTQAMNPDAELDSFLSALEQEIAGVSSVIGELGLQVENLYIGGGTPSILGADRMQRLINYLQSSLPLVDDLEFTVEAGRPDTVDEPLVSVLKEMGVNRVCINPQTLHNSTLQAIGRQHTAEDVLRAVELVRAARLPVLNMDVIVGLPGEGVAEWQYTLQLLTDIKPENITVHTLAAKKGSAWVLQQGVGKREASVGTGVRLWAEGLTAAGYKPYYLYRQKNMRSDEENVGYSLPGHICRYNIQVIEERQTIIGLGGGAGSKYVNTEDWTLTSSYNPKNPEVYVDSIERLVATKVDKLKSLNIE